GPFAIGTIVGAEDRVESFGSIEAIAQFRRRHAPSLRGPMTRCATASVRPERLVERVIHLRIFHADDAEDAGGIGGRQSAPHPRAWPTRHTPLRSRSRWRS